MEKKSRRMCIIPSKMESGLRQMYEHPDISSALATGYPCGAEPENRDTPENRADYIDDHRIELVEWLRMGYPEILDEFIEFSGNVCSVSYKNWLN